VYSVSLGEQIVLCAGNADHFMKPQVDTPGLDGMTPISVFVSQNFQSRLAVAYEGPNPAAQ
jgi:hypothetical protein